MQRLITYLPNKIWRGVNNPNALGALALFVLLWLNWLNPFDMSERARLASLDVFTRATSFIPAPGLNDLFLFVDIDEASLETEGQWPWPRSRLADLINAINADAPAAIGLDILLVEPDRFNIDTVSALSGLPADGLRTTLGETLFSGDDQLANQLATAPVVLATSLSDEYGRNKPYVPSPMAVIGDLSGQLVHASKQIAPIEILQQAVGGGFVNFSLDGDSFIRAIPLVALLEDEVVPSFALELLRVAQASQTAIIKTDADGTGLAKIKVGDVVTTVPDDAIMLLHHGDSKRFNSVPASDYFNGNGSGQAAGRIVIIGSTAAGMNDLKSTVLEDAVSGSFLHFQVIQQILSDRILVATDLLRGSEQLAMFLVTLGLLLIGNRLRAAHNILFLGLATIVGIYGQFWLFQEKALLANLYVNSGLPVIVSLISLLVRLMREERDRKQLKGSFGQYLSPVMVDRLARDPSALSLGGETREMTVLFADMRGFTSISEAMKEEPEKLTRIINRITTRLTTSILKHQGTIDKYMGDCIMAFWNAPLDDADHANNAVIAGLAMLEDMPRINQDLRDEGLLEANGIKLDDINVGVGIATGYCVVGNMGSEQRFDYTVLGDVVNLASRLEGATKAFGVPMLMSGRTAELFAIPEQLALLAQLQVKGKVEPVDIFTGFGEPTQPDISKHHSAFIQAWMQGDSDALPKLGAKASAHLPLLGQFYQLMLDRRTEFLANHPKSEWRAVTVLDNK